MHAQMDHVLIAQSTAVKMIKMLLLGNTNVGKTSMLHFFHRGKSLDNPLATIGIDFIPVKDKNDRTFAHIWDTGGLERYKCINRHYYTGANCVMIVYDVEHPTQNAYDQVQPWYDDLVDMCGVEAVQKIPIFVVGNKAEKLAKTQQMCASLKPLVERKNQRFKHMFTSARTGKNIQIAFSSLLCASQQTQNSPLVNVRTRVEVKQNTPVIHCCY